jgi:metal-responsive CopG/Arc/MetJ family transcriptional regulator
MPAAKSVAKPRIGAETARASVSFPADVYAELERIAAAKKVSLAWVVREAAERYVVDQSPPRVKSRGGA